MNTEYSITLTPSHHCVPVLMDFIIDHAEPPYPTRKTLVDMLVSLDRASIKRLNIHISKGEWCVEFIINDNVKIRGKAPKFNAALENALNEINSWPVSAAATG